MKDQQRILEEIADNIYGKIKENYFPKYYTIKVTQSKGGSFHIIVRKKSRLT